MLAILVLYKHPSTPSGYSKSLVALKKEPLPSRLDRFESIKNSTNADITIVDNLY